MDLTRAQLQAVAVLADGPARQSNATSLDARTVSWRTVRVLEQQGLVVDVAGYKAILTDLGRQVADDPPAAPPLKYEHGTHACYVLDQCRCTPCKVAASNYEDRRNKDNAYGRTRMVDAEPVRAHVRSLMCDSKRGSNHAGVGLKQIVKVSGVSQGSLWRLMYGSPDRDGPSRQVYRTTAEKLLAVTLADMADGATVPAGPTCKRVQQLRDAGATWTEIGEQLGMNRSNSHALSKRRRVQAGTARAVHDLWTRWKSGEWPPRGRPGGHAKAKLEREVADAS